MIVSRSGLLAFALSLAASVATAQEMTPVVVTQGEGVIRVAPDRARVNLQVETRAVRPPDAQRANADAMTAVSRALEALGLETDSIRTLGVNLQPEFDFVDGQRQLRGYVASNSIEVTVDDLSRVGEIVDRAVDAGATTVSGIQFDAKERRVLERRALEEAVADAKARAIAAAAGAGTEIAEVVRIEEQGAQPVQTMFRMSMQAESSQSVTPIAPGQIEIRAGVVLTAKLR